MLSWNGTSRDPEGLAGGDRPWDAVVIGAGPAGSLVARQMAIAGASVLLVDRKAFPRAKVCGACLNESSVGVLESVGLGAITRESGLPLDSLRIGLNGRRVDLPLPGGSAIEREVLDARLVDAARDAGVVFRAETGASLGDPVKESRRVQLTTHGERREAEARVVIVAAGLTGGTMGRDGDFVTRVARGARVGAGCAVREFPAFYREGTIFMAVGRGGYVGLTRARGGLNVAAAFDAGALKAAHGPARAARSVLDEAGFPEVPAIDSAEWSGTLPLTRSTRPVAADRVFLVGDAAGYVEPFTGQGMAFALEGAVALAPIALRGVRAWHGDVGRAWVAEYRRRVGSRQWPCHLVAAIARRPRVARVALALAGGVPAVPGALVRIINRPGLMPLSR